MTLFINPEQVTDYQHLSRSNSYPFRFVGGAAAEWNSTRSQVINSLILHQRTSRKIAPRVVSFKLKTRK